LFHAAGSPVARCGGQDEAVRHLFHPRRPQWLQASRRHLSSARCAGNSRHGGCLLRARAAAGLLKNIQLITDGACLGNPGPGGWACILRYNSHKRELVGSEAHTTNNRMELTAVIQGLKAVREACEAEVITDSQYVKNGITQWIHGWKRNGWKT